MDRIWQWAWDRYGATYSWVAWVVLFATVFPLYFLLSLLVVASERSNQYIEATVCDGYRGGGVDVPHGLPW